MFKRDSASQAMRKVNKTWLADELDRSIDSINDYLSGKRDCPKTVAVAWAVALRLDPMSFWDESASTQTLTQKAG